MRSQRRSPLILLLFAVPFLAAVLWGISGFEILTKSHKAVEMSVRNELFGDATSETRLAPGPIGGYYVGLDAVGAAIGLAMITLLIIRRFQLRRSVQEHQHAKA